MNTKDNSKTYTPDVYFEHVPMFKDGKKEKNKSENKQKKDKEKKNE